MNPSKLKYHTLLKRIHSVRQQEKLFSLLRGVLIFISANLLLLLLALTMNTLFHFKSAERVVIDALVIGASSIIFVYFILRPIFSLIFRKRHPSNNSLAERIGDQFASIKDQLINALQLFNFYNENPEGYSLELVGVALSDVHEKSEDKDFRAIINKTPILKSARLLIIASVISVVAWFLFSASFLNSANLLLHPLTNFEDEAKFQLTVSPGNIEVIKNENVEIKAVATGEVPEQLILHLKNVNNGYHLEKVLSKDQQNTFQYLIESIKDSTEYYFSSASLTSEKFLISVIELPMVRNLQLKLNYPSYSRIEIRFLDENVGDVTALRGTVAEIKIQANKNLSDTRLVFQNQKEQPLSIHRQTASGTMNIWTDDVYYVALRDLSGRENQDPINYRINIIEDNFPAVKILFPGRDIDITEEMQLTIILEAEDDFGFSDVQLAYKTIRGGINEDESGSIIQLKLENYQVEKFRLGYDWDLTDLNLFPEDMVTYYVEVFDNDNVSGPKSARSLTYHIRFPSMYEIYTEVQKEHEEAFQTFEGIYEQSKDLKEKLSELVQEMKKDPNLNWEEKKQLEDVVENQQQMQQALQDIEQKLDDMIERMEKNDLTSLETLKKYHELQELMKELMTDELKEAIKELQKAMENIDPEQLQKAVEKLDINQEDFLKQIEKTLSILKRLQIEQRLDEVAKKAEQLLKEQTELLEKSQDAVENELGKLAKEQQDIQQNTEDLKNSIADLKEKMSEFADMPTERIDAALDMMDRENITGNMSQASQNLQSGNRQGAQKHGQIAQNSLSELTDMLLSAKQELMQDQKQQVMAALNRVSHDLLGLSMRQEDVLKSGEKLSRNSSQYGNIAERQQDLLSGLNRVTERVGNLSKKTFFVTPEMARSLGQSLAHMQQALTELEERDGARASQNQGRAMVSLNEAIKQVQKSMNDLANASSSTGLEEMMQRLSQMACQQQGINEQTMQLGMGGQPLTLEQQAAMARLMAEQAALKKSLEQLQQEYGNRSEVLGRLDKIAEEMDDVIKDLQNKNVNRQTIERQRKILSRLLDAQKSVQRRDYSRKREAETGKDYYARSPDELPADLGERDHQLRQDLLKALKQGYTKDYQELIKKYFEALLNEAKNN